MEPLRAPTGFSTGEGVTEIIGLPPRREKLPSWKNIVWAHDPRFCWNVRIVAEREKLLCVVKDCISNTSLRLEVKEDVKTLKSLEPVYDGDSEVTFSPIFFSCDLPGTYAVVRLLQGKKRLFWQKWEPLYPRRTYLPFCHSFASLQCSPATKEQIDQLVKLPPDINITKTFEKYRCTKVGTRPLKPLKPFEAMLPAEEVVSFTQSWKCEVQVTEKGSILFIFNENLKLPTDPGKYSSFEYTNKMDFQKDLLPFFVEENNSIRAFFLTQEQIEKNEWQFVSRRYAVKNSPRVMDHWGSNTIPGFELIPHFLIPTAPFKTTITCNITAFIHVTESHSRRHETRSNKGGTSISVSHYGKGFVAPYFELSFPCNKHLPIQFSEITYVELEPLFICSFFDKTVPIIHNRWAFTVITRERENKEVLAEGIIEAFNAGHFKDFPVNTRVLFRFYFKENAIHASFPDRNQIGYQNKRSKVMYIAASQAQKVVANVLKEAQTSPLPSFDNRGIDAIGSKGHNSITWIRDHLKREGFDIGGSLFGFVSTRPASYVVDNPQPQNELL